jgi:hypothetical protein
VNGKGVLFFFNGQKILRFPILSANPTCVSSLEISKWAISPENTRSYQPYNIRTKKAKTIFTRGGVYTWVGKGYFFERAKKLKISNFVCQVGVSSLEIS